MMNDSENYPETMVIVPTYNEADNINDLFQQILDLPVSIGIINVDDNSPDGTGGIADKWAAEYPGRVLPIHRAGKLGLGTAYIAGFRKALSLHGVKRIMTMDADFSHNPRYIPAIIELSAVKHMVIGSRYVMGGGQENCSWGRIVLSRGANRLAKILLGLQAMDTTAGFRLYRREVLDTIPLDQIVSSGYSFLVEMLFLVQRYGFHVGEVPIVFEDRRAGTTKISRNEVYKGMATIGRLFVRRLMGKTPKKASVTITSGQ
ncbi:MAG: dolichol-phosphate mannosyltransferase [Cellvibrionaceae bacterium]|jgi:dolichol-phosphate mannosyltransferase